MRRLLHPKWLFWHVFVIVVAVTFVRLGLWQWHRAVDTRSPQSMGYALQWPFFAAFGVFVWVRICRDAVRTPKPATAAPGAKPSRRPPPPTAPPAAVNEKEDPELAAYNRYLAELNEGTR